MVSGKLQNEAWGKQDPLKLGIKTDYKYFLSLHLQLGFLVTSRSLRDQVFTDLQHDTGGSVMWLVKDFNSPSILPNQ